MLFVLLFFVFLFFVEGFFFCVFFLKLKSFLFFFEETSLWGDKKKAFSWSNDFFKSYSGVVYFKGVANSLCRRAVASGTNPPCGGIHDSRGIPPK